MCVLYNACVNVLPMLILRKMLRIQCKQEVECQLPSNPMASHSIDHDRKSYGC